MFDQIDPDFWALVFWACVALFGFICGLLFYVSSMQRALERQLEEDRRREQADQK